jgi:p-aminobenzoyl-glutamate transporter AbgT
MLDILFKTPVGILSVITIVMVFVIMAVIYGYFYKKIKQSEHQSDQ